MSLLIWYPFTSTTSKNCGTAGNIVYQLHGTNWQYNTTGGQLANTYLKQQFITSYHAYSTHTKLFQANSPSYTISAWVKDPAGLYGQLFGVVTYYQSASGISRTVGSGSNAFTVDYQPYYIEMGCQYSDQDTGIWRPNVYIKKISTSFTGDSSQPVEETIVESRYKAYTIGFENDPVNYVWPEFHDIANDVGWHHMAASFDFNTKIYRIYYDGECWGDYDFSDEIAAIGLNTDWSYRMISPTLTGVLDHSIFTTTSWTGHWALETLVLSELGVQDYRFYDEALPPDYIRELASGLVADYTDIITNFPSQQVTDCSGHDHHGQRGRIQSGWLAQNFIPLFIQATGFHDFGDIHHIGRSGGYPSYMFGTGYANSYDNTTIPLQLCGSLTSFTIILEHNLEYYSDGTIYTNKPNELVYWGPIGTTYYLCLSTKTQEVSRDPWQQFVEYYFCLSSQTTNTPIIGAYIYYDVSNYHNMSTTPYKDESTDIAHVYSIAFTYDGTTFIPYINGEEQSYTTFNFTINNYPTPGICYFRQSSGNSVTQVPGTGLPIINNSCKTLSRFQLYSSILTPEQIKQYSDIYGGTICDGGTYIAKQFIDRAPIPVTYDNPLIIPNGQVYVNELIEDDTTNVVTFNKDFIKSKLFIEI